MRETERGHRGRERPTDSLCPPESIALALVPPILTFPQSYDIFSCLPLPPSPAGHSRDSPPAPPSPPNTVPHLANSCSSPFLQEALPVSTAPLQDPNCTDLTGLLFVDGCVSPHRISSSCGQELGLPSSPASLPCSPVSRPCLLSKCLTHWLNED